MSAKYKKHAQIFQYRLSPLVHKARNSGPDARLGTVGERLAYYGARALADYSGRPDVADPEARAVGLLAFRLYANNGLGEAAALAELVKLGVIVRRRGTGAAGALDATA